MRRLGAVFGSLTLLFIAAACSGSDSAEPRGACPTTPIRVAVSVDQWSDLTRTLAGDCARVDTVVRSTASDPHDYEPTPGDIATLTGADIVVLNGQGYDDWAAKAVGAARPQPTKVVAASAAKASPNDNAHLWYDPRALPLVANAVTRALTRAQPAAASYLRQRSAAWSAAVGPYEDALDRVRSIAADRTFASTEPVADALAGSVGLRNVTPTGFAVASASGNEPSPGDVAALLQRIQERQVDVLIVNAQHRSNLTDRLLTAARSTGTPIVTVTETVPPGAPGFVEWQVSQLDALRSALAKDAS